MPRDNQIIPLRMGHIDTMDNEPFDAPCALSVEFVNDPTLGVMTMMHMDVAAGGDVTEPMSIGIPLTTADVEVVIRALSLGRHRTQQQSNDRLN